VSGAAPGAADTDLVTVGREGRVASVRLNRPEKLNALSTALIEAATVALQRFEHDRQISVIVLSGAGRAFSAGVDITEIHGLNEASGRTLITRLHGLMALVRRLSQIVVAAVHGHCYGGACELAAACDIRIAAEDVIFGMPEIKVGIPSVIEAALFVPLIGLGRAADFVYSGDEIGGTEAQRIGLVTRVVPAETLMPAAQRLATQIAAFSGPALRLQKELVQSWYGDAYDRAIERGIDIFAASFRSANPQEAVTAFLERRAPNFTDL